VDSFKFCCRIEHSNLHHVRANAFADSSDLRVATWRDALCAARKAERNKQKFHLFFEASAAWLLGNEPVVLLLEGSDARHRLPHAALAQLQRLQLLHAVWRLHTEH
jgi:hypothetical protein